MGTKFDTALNELRRMCAAGRREGRIRLPTIAELAQRCNVAVPTLWRAVQRLKAEGVITARPRSGIYIVGDPGVITSREPPARSRRKVIRERLIGDLLRGVFRYDKTLPPLKELAVRYGCTQQTMRRILLSAVSDGYLQLERRGFRIPPAQMAGSGEIILIACADHNGELAAITPRTDLHLQALETSCASVGVKLVPVGWDVHRGLRYTHTLKPFDPKRHSAGLRGYVIWTLDMPEETITSLVRTVHAGAIPVALCDENGETSSCMLPSEPAPVKRFLLSDNTEAGEAIGRLLLQYGHRSIVFLGPVQLPFPTVQTRLRGLRSVFERAGLSQGVAVADITELPWHLSHLQERRQMRSRILTIAADTQRFDEHTARRLVEAAGAVDSEDTMKEVAAQCWEKCLPALRAGCAAIVAFNDDLALAVMTIAAQKRIRIPDQMSIVGFDNTRSGAMAGLTSYDLNGPAVMHAMVSYVLNPHGSPAGRRRGPIRIAGNVIIRSSCGPYSESAVRRL